MPASVRRIDEADRLTARILRTSGEEFLERRLELAASQSAVAAAANMSRNHYAAIEHGSALHVSITELTRVAVVLGLAPSYRLFPGGPSIRDRGHATKLVQVGGWVRRPLTLRYEVPLPATTDRFERRAWDAMLTGAGLRTAFELEMRVRDAQAIRRRIDLKRRDDPVDRFVLLVADTRNNRMVLHTVADVFADLPRLRASSVRGALEAAIHPPSGLLFL